MPRAPEMRTLPRRRTRGTANKYGIGCPYSIGLGSNFNSATYTCGAITIGGTVYNYIFNKLDYINRLRNRIAHHEPICFMAGLPIKTVSYIQAEHKRIMKLFTWMDIDGSGLLYGIDHVQKASKMILDL